jgi:hypothetical protein
MPMVLKRNNGNGDLRTMQRCNSFWLLKANPLVHASSFVANAVMLLFSSMVNVFILMFLSFRALAVTTSITLVALTSKLFLRKIGRGDCLANRPFGKGGPLRESARGTLETAGAD